MGSNRTNFTDTAAARASKIRSQVLRFFPLEQTTVKGGIVWKGYSGLFHGCDSSSFFFPLEGVPPWKDYSGLFQGKRNMGNAATTESEWITKQEAAELLSVSLKTIQKYVSQGKLTARYERGKTGEVMFVPLVEVESIKALHEQMTFKPSVQSLPALPPPPSSLPMPMIPENISEALSRFLSMATMPPPSKLMLTLEEASSVSGLPKSFLKAAILESRLHAAKISRRWLIKRTALEAFVSNL